MFNAFVGTLAPEGVWYEYSWHEYQPVYGTKRTWWGRKEQVQVSEEKITKSTGMSQLGYSVEFQRLVFQMPGSFQAAADTYDLLLSMYVAKDEAMPFVDHACSPMLRRGETFSLSTPPALGIGDPSEW